MGYIMLMWLRLLVCTEQRHCYPCQASMLCAVQCVLTDLGMVIVGPLRGGMGLSRLVAPTVPNIHDTGMEKPEMLLLGQHCLRSWISGLLISYLARG